MVHNFPLSTQIGLFPEQLKKEVWIIYVVGLCCFKTFNLFHHHHHLFCMLHLKLSLCNYQFFLITDASKQHTIL
jgi:hypothetical protein